MSRQLFLFGFVQVAAFFVLTSFARAEPPLSVTADAAAADGCVSCHRGIEDIIGGDMLEDIEDRAEDYDDPYGCVICHGGNILGLTPDEAHRGAPAELTEQGGPNGFYPDPGALEVAHRSCGQCHDQYAERVRKSAMVTEAGRHRALSQLWGLPPGEKSIVFGNFAIEDEDGAEPVVGTKAYLAYMAALVEKVPNLFVKNLQPLPDGNYQALADKLGVASVTNGETSCVNCHLGAEPRERSGEWRGQGCSACHVPYSRDGRYEGGDIAIDKQQTGRPRVHRIQSGQSATVTIGDESYSGIPLETCLSCHERGRRTPGTEVKSGRTSSRRKSPEATAVNADGAPDSEYLADVHHQQESSRENPAGGMLCQDCHTSIDAHGDGNIPTHKLAQVEIECQDCHGLPTVLPWDLPLGTGEEYGRRLQREPRGIAEELPRFMRKGFVHEPEDGYLLTARGNPYGNVVRRGKQVILHSATGREYEVPVLKLISDAGTHKSRAAKRHMGGFAVHTRAMECYGCHANFVPVCDAGTPRTRSHLRWGKARPSRNVEGRQGPVLRPCPDVRSKRGVNSLVTVQPHSAARKPRVCEECHEGIY